MSKNNYEFNNVKVQWAKLNDDNVEKPYQGKGVDNWTLQVILSDEQSDAYKKTGFFPKFKRDMDNDLVLEDGLRQVKLKKSTTFGVGGKPKKGVVVVDAYGNPFNDLIGNGSVCNIQCSSHNWTRDGKTGITLELQAVQVLELVEFETSGDEFTPSFSFEKQKEVALADVKVEADDEDIPF
jgi:hypothetical protein